MTNDLPLSEANAPRRRAAQACTLCRKSKIRCSGRNHKGLPCLRCKERKRECIFADVASQGGFSVGATAPTQAKRRRMRARTKTDLFAARVAMLRKDVVILGKESQSFTERECIAKYLAAVQQELGELAAKVPDLLEDNTQEDNKIVNHQDPTAPLASAPDVLLQPGGNSGLQTSSEEVLPCGDWAFQSPPFSPDHSLPLQDYDFSELQQSSEQLMGIPVTQLSPIQTAGWSSQLQINGLQY